jgi:hypothetical protein
MAIGRITSPTTWYQGTVFTPSWGNNVQDTINAYMDATVSLKGLYVDGTGGATVTTVVGKVIARSAALSVTPGAAAGSAPTISVAGSDTAGYVDLTVGAMPTTGTLFTVTFSSAFPTIMGAAGPIVMLVPGNANAAALSGTTQVYVSSLNTANFVVTTGSAALSSIAYRWYFHTILG